jgi:hypothetical protein
MPEVRTPDLTSQRTIKSFGEDTRLAREFNRPPGISVPTKAPLAGGAK